MPTQLHILGAGRAARVLARALADTGTVEIGQVCNATQESARSAVEFMGQGQVVERIGPIGGDDCLLLGLPDQRLLEPEHWPIDGRAPVAFHLSGALPSSVLSSVAEFTASVHPARAFSDPEYALAQLPGTWVMAEGHAVAMGRLQPLFEAAGLRWQELKTESKMLYHAATVVASNYLVTLADLARTLAEKAELPESVAIDLIGGLQQGTLGNLAQQTAAAALTGPIERADVVHVRRLHEAMVAACPDQQALFNSLGLATLELAIQARGPKAEDDGIRALFTRP